MRRILLTIIELMYCSFVLCGAEKTTIDITGTTGSRGDYISVPVHLIFSDTEQLAPYVLQGSLRFDSDKLSFVTLSMDSSILADNSWTITGFDDGMGNIRLLASGTKVIENDGLIFELIFVVASGVSETAAIWGDPQDWVSNNSKAIIDLINSGMVQIRKPIATFPKTGDANEDNFVNIDDANVIGAHLLNISPLSKQGIENADVNRDGHLTVNDALSVLKFSTTGDWNKTKEIVPSIARDEVNVSIRENEVKLATKFRDTEELNTLELDIEYDPSYYELTRVENLFSDIYVINQFYDNKEGKLRLLLISASNYANTLNLFTPVFKLLNETDKLPLNIRYIVNGGEEISKLISIDNLTSVQNNKNEFDFRLNQNYPNPFNPATTISFGIKEESTVELVIYDMLGKEVATLIDKGLKPAGNYSVIFNAGKLSSGTYFYKLATDDLIEVKKMILAK